MFDVWEGAVAVVFHLWGRHNHISVSIGFFIGGEGTNHFLISRRHSLISVLLVGRAVTLVFYWWGR